MLDPIVAPWRDRLSNALMLIVALGASLAFASASRALTAASPDARAMEIWRMLGYLAFAVIFILLAMHPRRYHGLWELSFLHYGSLFLAAVVPGVTAVSGKIIVLDALTAVVIGASYFLTKGYLAWKSVEVSTHRMTGAAGFEPATSRVTAGRSAS
jgi:hypothetical protein